FRPGAWIVNTARGVRLYAWTDLMMYRIFNRLPKTHIWRTIRNPLDGNGMVSFWMRERGMRLGGRAFLSTILDGKPQEPQNVIIGLGK
ncbi:hypothetical protein MPER_03590, partial [Moniliophthora perniciosa FA553]